LPEIYYTFQRRRFKLFNWETTGFSKKNFPHIDGVQNTEEKNIIYREESDIKETSYKNDRENSNSDACIRIMKIYLIKKYEGYKGYSLIKLLEKKIAKRLSISNKYIWGKADCVLTITAHLQNE